MVKAGKFAKHNLGWAMPAGANLTASPPAYGVNSMGNRRLWFGTVSKISAGGASQAMRLTGPTWGFTWIDYAEIHSRPYLVQGQTAGTVFVIANHTAATGVRLPTMLNANMTPCFMLIWGR